MLDSNNKAVHFGTYAAGYVFDLRNELWAAVPSDPLQPVMPLFNNCSFIWDSLRINYHYTRKHTDTSIKDTLFIYYYTNFTDTQLRVDFTADSIKYTTPLPFDNSSLSGQSYFRKDTLLLSIADTATSGLIKRQVNQIHNSPGVSYYHTKALFGFSVVYKPGHPYGVGDTLYHQNGDSAVNANLFGLYYSRALAASNRQFFSKFTSGNSLWLDKNNRYGGNYNGINGFIPGTATPEIKQVHCAAFATAACKVSVQEIQGIFTAQLFPNPVKAGDAFTVKIQSQAFSDSKILVINYLGQTLYSVEKSVVAGENNITIDTFLPAGVYLLRINDGQYIARLVVID
jgi:hypothetical protein